MSTSRIQQPFIPCTVCHRASSAWWGDELLLWDHDRLWIYRSDAEADPGALMKRERPPLYNMSNFHAYWSRAARKG